MRILLFFLTIALSLNVSAHQFLPTEARLEVTEDKTLKLNVQIDLIEMYQQTLALNATARSLGGSSLLFGNEQQNLISTVKSLSDFKLQLGLDLIQTQLLENTELNVDGDAVRLTRVLLPPVEFIKALLSKPSQSTEYRVDAVVRQALPMNVTAVKLKLPLFLGDIKLTQQDMPATLVAAGAFGPEINIEKPEPPSLFKEAGNYLYQGILHIIPKGLDHILFILALFLLSTRVRPLLWQVTVFTVAHTITLLMAGYQVVNVPANIVEPLIAFSIAFVALENIYHNQLKSWRIFVIFGFGLLHGLGFASVLLEFGLPEQWAFISLVSFNVGVEFGQLFVVVGAFLLVGWFRNKAWYRKFIVIPISGLIAATGLFWTVERLIA